ncbi:MAG: dihydrodipicolinate synthase family protein [Pseudomonadota bacterium]
MDRAALHGMHPATVTPFSPAGEIMEDAFVEIVRALVDRGATGVCIAGDNGESWALSAEERGRLVRLAAEAVPGTPISCGCSAPTLAAAISYARAAAENGAGALLSMPPTYVMKGSRDEVLRRYAALAEAGLPIIAYNSPRRAGFSLGLEDLEAVLDVAPVIGLKESSRDFFHHSHVLHRFADRIAVMTGPCHYIVPSLPLGAAGFIATGPEFLPGGVMETARDGTEAERRALHHRLTVIYETLMGTGTWPSALKCCLNLLGLPAGVPRDPVSAASPQMEAELRATLEALELL